MAASQSFDNDRQFMLLETSSLKQRSPPWVHWMIIGFWSRNVRQQHYRYNGTGRLPTVGCWAYCQWDRWFVGLLTLMFHMHQHFHWPRAVSFHSVSMVNVRIEFWSTKKRMRGFSLIPSNLDIHMYIYHYIFSNMLRCIALLPMQAVIPWEWSWEIQKCILGCSSTWHITYAKFYASSFCNDPHSCFHGVDY